jgi:hypothetical protein
MRIPLYSMSAGDLGLDPRSLEIELSKILEMVTKWNAILLLDEADVFLEQRSPNELERNKLVSSKSHLCLVAFSLSAFNQFYGKEEGKKEEIENMTGSASGVRWKLRDKYRHD